MSERDITVVLAVAGVVVQTTLLLLIAIWVRRRVRPGNPALSHLILWLGLVGVLAVPVVASLGAPRTLLTIRGAGVPAPAVTSNYQPNRETSSTLVRPRSGMPFSTTEIVPAAVRTPLESVRDEIHYVWFLPAACLWFLGFIAIAVRSLDGFQTLWALRRYGSIPFSRDDLDLPALGSRAGVSAKWDLRECATREMAVPITWGIFHSTVMLPTDADQWPKARLEAVVLHELAHVRRWDFLTQATAELACALFWFNPLVWITARALRADAETAADDAVLRTGLRPSDYAAELLQVAADLGHRRLPLIYIGTPAMRNSKIESRLHDVLSPNAGRRGVTSLQALTAVLVAALAVPALATIRAVVRGQDGSEAELRTQALSRIKQAALATLMYVNDYDDLYPYVQQTSTARGILMPYCKDKNVFLSPTPGGKFLFNMNLAGVEPSAIMEPSVTPMWFETLPDPAMAFVVAFADGHAKSMKDHDFLNKGLKVKFARKSTSKPLPANWPPSQ